MNNSLGRHNLPPKNYAIKTQKPKLRREVEQTLTNRFYQIYPKEDATIIDTYYIMSKNSYYQGSWKGGLPHGSGNAIYPDGSYYIGNFDCGEAEDKQGCLILSNGAQYEGNIVRSKIEGRGRLKHKLEYFYEGQWTNGRPHGQGIEKYEDGSTYKGYFENGYKSCYDPSRTIQQKKQKKPQRVSIYTIGDDIYQGEFKQGLMHGYGELTSKSKNLTYRGQFCKGKKQGYGSLQTFQGKLTGKFHNDVINGQGVFEWRDGRRYEGSFKNSKFEGKGNIIFPEGNQLIGEWREGQSERLKAVFGGNGSKNHAKQGQQPYGNYKNYGFP